MNQGVLPVEESFCKKQNYEALLEEVDCWNILFLFNLVVVMALHWSLLVNDSSISRGMKFDLLIVDVDLSG